MKNSCHVRAATEADLVAINDIYNHYLLHSTCTYQEEPEAIESRRQWFSHHGEMHPIIVAAEGSEVIGWGSLSAYHARSAYRRTVKNSVYVHHQHHGEGIGSLLLEELIALARTHGHRALMQINRRVSLCTQSSNSKKSDTSSRSASSSAAGLT